MQELPRSTDARDQAAGRGRYEDPHLGAGRAQIHDVDRWWHSGRVEYIPKGECAYIFYFLR